MATREFMTCALIISLVSCTTSEHHELNITFNEETHTATIEKSEYAGDIVIPSETKHNLSTYYIAHIADEAFMSCDSLTSITLPEGLRTIGERAFFGCTRLAQIAIPQSVTQIAVNAFRETKYFKDSNNWTDNALYIGPWLIKIETFDSTFTIPKTVTHIADGAFSGFLNHNPLKSIEVSVDNTHFTSDDGVLYDKSKSILIAYPRLKNDTLARIAPNVTEIAPAAFLGCTNIKHVSFNDAISHIDNGTFRGCKSLLDISLPASITHIGDKAFSWCNELRQIAVQSTTPPTLGDNVFEGVGMHIALYVPRESIEKYREAKGWKDFKNILPIE